MSFGILLLINLACLLEAMIAHFLIQKGWIDVTVSGLNIFIEVLAFVALKNIVILGIYQLYFWPQRNVNEARVRVLKPSKLDKIIPAVPLAFWLYSPFYYLIFNLSFFCSKNYKIVIMNAWLMLLHACFWFKVFPTRLPKGFRENIKKKSMDRLTRILLNLVHDHDSEESAIPSMHCAFAVFASCSIYHCYPTLALVFPFVIAISCLLCKQHLVIDIIPGVLLGALHGGVYLFLSKYFLI